CINNPMPRLGRSNSFQSRLSAGLLDESSLKIYYWDAATGQWVAVPTVVDAANNTLTATLDHLTRFALLGQQWRLYLPVVSRYW
ncbi:MAG: hypothetical protein HYX94_07255, partial [Chloroflexi bacterium]|nr:hypothetical protein [Chloroflexota bacterium]